MQCSICSGPIEEHRHPETGEVYWTEGHNAEPVNDGRCCASCNENVVMRARLQKIFPDSRIESVDHSGGAPWRVMN